jgi:hypothetical protein
MNFRIFRKALLFILVTALILSGCNFPTSAEPENVVTQVSPTEVVEQPATDTPLPLPTETPTTEPTETETPEPTATMEQIAVTVLPTAAPTNTFAPPPPPGFTASVQGYVVIEKPVGVLPLGGASLTLYRDSDKSSVVSTRTNFEGGFLITKLPGDKYYVALVWTFGVSAWPCANSALPEVGKKADWKYTWDGLVHYVEIRNNGQDNFVLSLGTSAFTVERNGVTNVQINVLCKQIK